jgi:signal transduction histidine kinase
METGTAIRAINRRALLAFTGVLAALVMSVALLVLTVQRQQLHGSEREYLETELLLLGELGTDALLRSDYATVEGQVQRWVDRHDNIIFIRAVMPNDFVLGERRKAREARSPLRASHDVRFGDRVLMTLHAESDISGKEDEFVVLVFRLVTAALVLILLLGWALWRTLKRTALQPLERQISQREEKEHELTQRTAELETALNELESFSYSVSHDLRAPLRAIDGYSHALLEDHGQALDATARGYVTRTRVAAQRMGTLIDDLLALSKMTRRELADEEVDLSVLAHHTLAQLAQLDPQRRVEIEVADGMRVRGDTGLLAIALENLLSNAWKYTARCDRARISFQPTRHNGQTVYHVRDNGAGFDMTYADKLFRPFQRLHTDGDFTGSGIGLATVARIIQRHGGRVWAQGEPGKGAVFSFTLGT